MDESRSVLKMLLPAAIVRSRQGKTRKPPIRAIQNLEVKRDVTIAVVCLILSGVSSAVAAQRPMSLVDSLNIPAVSDPQISPDGGQVVYVFSRADWKADRQIGQIWRINTDGSGILQMTHGATGASSPRWSPDGKTIAFLAKRDTSRGTQIYLLPNDGGEAAPLIGVSSSTEGIADISWAPDGSAIYFIASERSAAGAASPEQVPREVPAFEEDYAQRHLWRIRVADSVQEQVTQGDYSVLDYSLSRDGRRVVLQRSPTPLIGDFDQGEVWIMDLAGTNALQLTHNRVPESGATLSPDGSQVLFLARAKNAEAQVAFDVSSKIFLVPATGGEARIVSSELPYEVIPPALWSKDGRFVFFVANMGVHRELFRLEVATSKVRQLTDGQHSVGSLSSTAAGDWHAFTISEPHNPGDLWVRPANGDAAPRRISHIFDYLAREFRLARQEKVEWKGADGVTVEGLLWYPLDYRPGQRYPLAVRTHGGPQNSDSFGFGEWPDYPHVLAALGYGLLLPNYRGSAGYGDAFMQDMMGHYFNNSHLDVMAGVDHLIETGFADPDRLVKMGFSAGGTMTSKIITFTDRFKAASVYAGIANYISLYAQSEARWWRPWFGGTPYQKNAPIDVYWEASPLKYAANVTTPTIFLVGELDPSNPPEQPLEMYRALKSNGVPTHLYIVPGEGHSFVKLRHRLFKMNVQLDWFEKYARNRQYVWEKAPTDANAIIRNEKSR